MNRSCERAGLSPIRHGVPVYAGQDRHGEPVYAGQDRHGVPGYAGQDRHGVPGYAAFSLIEVLIAVMVLAVGLLGLASVFPVVITQQREAADVVLGGVASSVVRDHIFVNADIAAELLSQDGFADADEPDRDGDRVPNESPGQDDPEDIDGDGIPEDYHDDVLDEIYVWGRDELIFGQGRNYQNNGRRYNQRTGYSYLWEADWSWGDNLGGGQNVELPSQFYTDYIEDGGVRFRDNLERARANVSIGDADLPVSARLYPGPYTVPGQPNDGPQFVWDFVPRRTPDGGLQMAVFVRRIDTGIRFVAGLTLSEMLIEYDWDDDEHRYPVGRDKDTGEPTRDGTGEYSIPLSVKAEPVPSSDYPHSTEANLDPNPLPVLLDGVRLDTGVSGDDELATSQHSESVFLAQVGQRFVDNFGIVRRVTEVLKIEDGEIDIRVEPAFAYNQLYFPFDTGFYDGSDALRETARTGKLRQIVFTPQVPVDVFVMEFTQQ